MCNRYKQYPGKIPLDSFKFEKKLSYNFLSYIFDSFYKYSVLPFFKIFFKFVFDAVTDVIIKNNLKDCGLF